MTLNYAKRLPYETGGSPMQDYPSPFKRQSQNYFEAGLAQKSSVLSLTDNTVQIEVGTTNAPAILRWVPTTDGAAAPAGSVLTTNFDHYIPKDAVRKFVVPRESNGAGPSIVGANVLEGLYKRVAVACLTNGSILTTEY